MSKKFKILVVTMVVVIMAMIVPSAIVMAQEGEDTATASTDGQLFARVAGILGVNQEKLENAFEQAREEMREAAPDWCTGNATASCIREQLANRQQIRQMLREEITNRCTANVTSQENQECIQEKLQNRQQIRQHLREEMLNGAAGSETSGARISRAMRGRHMIAVAER